MSYYDILKELNKGNLNRIKALFDEIETEFQMKGEPNIVIDFLPPNCRPRPSKEKITEEYSAFESSEISKRLGALNFLKKHNVVVSHNVDSFHHRQDGNTQYHIEIKLAGENLSKLKNSMERLHNTIDLKPLIKNLKEQNLLSRRERLVQKEAELQTKKESSKGILYQVEFTKNNEIFINEFLLQKPHFGNENAKVFRYLFENPNQTIVRSDLQKKVGSVGKDFRKIVENLGFTGNYQKVFFQISKNDSILFRNPISVNDLQDLKIPRLSLKLK